MNMAVIPVTISHAIISLAITDATMISAYSLVSNREGIRRDRLTRTVFCWSPLSRSHLRRVESRQHLQRHIISAHQFHCIF
jgi:hypothetical protein